MLGGTFDPVHLGHLVAAEAARYAVGLDKVLFLPAGQPPHKAPGWVAGVDHRVRMVELAIAGNPAFELSLVDAVRPGRSYTVETLDILLERLDGHAELFFIIGMDSLAELTTWKDPGGVISRCKLVVVNRPPFEDVDVPRLEREVPGIAERVILVRMPGIGIAARDLRDRVARGEPIRYLVPDAVADYIRKWGLYRTDATRHPA